MRTMILLALMLVPTLGLADPCVPVVDTSRESALALFGPGGVVEVFEFGFQIDAVGRVLVTPDCLVVGTAEATGDPFLFAAKWGMGGFDETPSNHPWFGAGANWTSPQGNFQSLPYPAPLGAAQQIDLLGLEEDGTVTANITFWEDTGPRVEGFQWDLTPDILTTLRAPRTVDIPEPPSLLLFLSGLLLLYHLRHPAGGILKRP